MRAGALVAAPKVHVALLDIDQKVAVGNRAEAVRKAREKDRL
ncbi:hypothetical protein FBY35_2519 [Streptomyces sp. SLBN-118]|nr:hypothetical protein FBY35_2519 [Streptomyces sp. SLBN-118]